MSPVRTAVVLAAGMGTRLGEEGRSQPKGFLRLGTKPIIEESLERLRRAGVERVLIVTGHCRESYEDLARASEGFVSTVHNPHFSESGSMYSLYCAKDEIDDDFLLLESDLIYEQNALQSALEFPQDNCLLLSGFTDSGDEVYVQQDEGRLVAMSKNPSLLGDVAGELVGITRVSSALFSHMLAVSEEAFGHDLYCDYETDCLVTASTRYRVYCHLVSELAWAEIGTEAGIMKCRFLITMQVITAFAVPGFTVVLKGLAD